MNKGVLALIALLLGYWISRRLEDYKNAQQRVSALERDKDALRSELERVKRTHELEFKEKQLSLFYWPIYSRFVKDSALWKVIPQLSDESAVSDKVGREIELNHLIKNHEEIVSLIESNIYLAGADRNLMENLAAYIRHVAVYKALRATNTYDLSPIDVGEPLPDEIILAIEARLKQLQAEYDELVQTNA